MGKLSLIASQSVSTLMMALKGNKAQHASPRNMQSDLAQVAQSRSASVEPCRRKDQRLAAVCQRIRHRNCIVHYDLGHSFFQRCGIGQVKTFCVDLEVFAACRSVEHSTQNTCSCLIDKASDPDLNTLAMFHAIGWNLTLWLKFFAEDVALQALTTQS
jgi:hypothetical protein